MLLFDAPLARDRVELEKPERFSRVVVGEDSLALLPSEALREGECLRLTVHFAGGVTPAEARFLLVVVPGKVDAQVEVVRALLPSEQARGESNRMEEELQQLREENARLRAERGPGGLIGALVAPWSEGKGIGIHSNQQPHVTGAELHQPEATCFRVAKRVAVQLTVTFSRSEPPWSIGGAALIGPDGRRLRIVQTWQSGPTAGGARGVRVIVEAEAERNMALDPHTVELREAGGDRTLTFGPVTFPDL